MAANRGYAEILDILGPECAIIPIGDPAHENAARTTVTTVGRGAGDGIVFTYSEARTAFDLPTSYTRSPNRIPEVPHNGSDEEADTPDADFWDGGDATDDNAISFGVWVTLNATATEDLLVKDAGGGSGNWRFGTRRLLIRDASAGVQCRRDRNTNPSLGVRHFLVMTYSGVGGGSAANGITMYEDGAVAASAATNSGSYVAMEPNTQLVTLAKSLPSVQFFNGKMAGGELGLFFTKQELTALEVANLYAIGKQYLAGGFLIQRRLRRVA